MLRRRHIITLAVSALLGASPCLAGNPAPTRADQQQQLRDFTRKVDSLQKSLDAYEARLAPEKDADKQLKEIYQIATQCGLQTRSIKTEKADHKADYTEQPVVFNVRGDFAGVYPFLQNVESLQHFQRITHLKLAKGDDGKLDVQMVVSLFFEGDKATPQAAGSHHDDEDELEQIQVLQARQKKMMARMEFLSSLIEPMPRSFVLGQIANTLPSGVAMSEFTVDATSGGVKIKTTGSAKTDEQVATFAGRLTKNALLKDVGAPSVNPTKPDGRQFEIEMMLNPDARISKDATVVVEAK